MIKNWDYHELHMDFSSMYDGGDHPSDIDMFYLCKDNTLIIGEIKNIKGTFTDGQRNLLTRVLDSHKWDAVGLYITHDKFVQNGDKAVDVSQCRVQEIYIKSEKQWRQPRKLVTVKEIIEYYKERAKWKMTREY